MGITFFFLLRVKVSGYDYNNKKFSPCSLRSIRAVLLAKSSRCFTEPEESFCGNLRVEKGEECDAGLVGTEDVDNCCDKTCKLRVDRGAKCSDKNSPCCRNCKFMSPGIKCRDAQRGTCEKEARLVDYSLVVFSSVQYFSFFFSLQPLNQGRYPTVVA